ncbi:MAG: FxDxF family PEP-CTERM protein [Gammaproteobacteria bacterium]|nr:FxDxF family PEP-CTERM protein [Gammaproteobacteria bacterium]
MIATRILTSGAIGACALLALVAPARADSLALTCQLLSPGSGTSCPATAPVYAVPGQYNYVDSFSHPTASGSIAGSDIHGGPANGDLGPAGFIDDYFFQISPASADAVSATISNGTFAVSNLFASLYSLSANPGGLVLTQPAGKVYYGDITSTGPATLVQINPVTLSAGSYVLQISGTSSGSAGGSYTGTLNLSPVPLPPSLPLLLTALLGLAGLMFRQRERL